MRVFDTVSPLDYRYYGGDTEIFRLLQPYVSEAGYLRYLLRVELALVSALAQLGICPESVAQEVRLACQQITPQEVYREEARIQHNIRALVNCIRRRVSDQAKPYIHLFATSADIMDTASALRYRELTQDVLLPAMLELERLLIDMARRYQAVVQIGRTHGQHAVPITFGFALAEYVSRLGGRILAIQQAAGNLRGQLSGAVGAYNAFRLVSGDLGVDAEELERRVLGLLGLRPATHSTQICEPEYLLDLVCAVVSAFSVVANLADDLRHLQRSEIAEVYERQDKDRVGSSTMPHKVNPKDFENVKSLWKAFMPRINTLFLDQLSEHQRDLTNSASGRFTTEIFVAFISALRRMTKVLARLEADQANMQRNFAQGKDQCLAEAIYTLLAYHGHGDAHETVRRLAMLCRKKGGSLREALQQDGELQSYLAKLSDYQREVLERPERYLGIAQEKTRQVCDYWEERLFSKT